MLLSWLKNNQNFKMEFDINKFTNLTVPDPANYPGTVSSGDIISLPFIAANDAFPQFYSETGIKSVKHYINRFDVDFGVAARTLQPGQTSTAVFTDLEVPMIDYDAKIHLDPYKLEKYWPDFKYTGRLVMPDLNPLTESIVLNQFQAKSGEYVGNILWKGDAVLGLKGIVEQGNDATTGTGIDKSTEVTGVAGGLTAANFIEEMNKLKNAVIAGKPTVYASPTFAYVMSYATASKYEEAQQAVNGKGPLVSERGYALFAGKEIIPQYGMPDDTIIATHLGSAATSNLRMLTGDLTDPETLVMDRLAADSREFFIMLTVKLGASIVRPDEYFFYTEGA